MYNWDCNWIYPTIFFEVIIRCQLSGIDFHKYLHEKNISNKNIKNTYYQTKHKIINLLKYFFFQYFSFIDLSRMQNTQFENDRKWNDQLLRENDQQSHVGNTYRNAHEFTRVILLGR